MFSTAASAYESCTSGWNTSVLGAYEDSGYADLYYSPNGDLYAFYTSNDGDDRFVFRKRQATRPSVPRQRCG